jgi:uncharacterized membrane protein YbjE (DUF340 family)
MTILITLGPLLVALLLGYFCSIRALSSPLLDKSLKWLTMAMLALIGYSIGGLENLQSKLYSAGMMALLLFALVTMSNIGFLTLSGRIFDKRKSVITAKAPQQNVGFSFGVFSDSLETIFWVLLGGGAGYFSEGFFHQADALVTWMLYCLLFLIGQQLYRGNYRLRSLFLNVQGLIIGATVFVSTLLAGVVGAWFLEIPIFHGMAVVSGFGWYSLSGILLTDLGSPALGTTACLFDICGEICGRMLIPLLSRINRHCSVGYSGATAMDFTLPMLGKFHGAIIIPTAIASGFVLSLMVPILIPLLLSL